MSSYEEALRRLSLNDAGILQDEAGIGTCAPAGLDAKTCALSRVGALAAVGGGPTSYQWVVSAALESGATVDEVVAVLMSIAPVVGAARVVEAAPHLALALGYDVEAALERLLEPADPGPAGAP